jgi:hypothetical protein
MAFKLRKTFFPSEPIKPKKTSTVETLENSNIPSKSSPSEVPSKTPPNYPEREHFIYDKQDKKWKIIPESELWKYRHR